MEVHVNWLAVVLATVSSMVVGFVWYARPVFGNLWMKLVGLKESDMTKGSAKAIPLTIVASFITAYVLAHVTYLAHSFFGNSFLVDALQTAFWLWLGLTAARVLVHDLFEKRPLTLTLLTVGHELVTLLIMALIIGLLKPAFPVVS
jgi:hypothetical protein